MSTSSWSQRARRDASTADRSAASAKAVPTGADCDSATKIGELERSVLMLDEALHLRFGFAKLLGREAEAFHALLKELEGARQLDFIALELRDDALQPLQSLFEGHDPDLGSSVLIERRTSCAVLLTMPSRS